MTHTLHYFLPIVAVFAGYLFVQFFKMQRFGRAKLLLAFSGAFLLAITVFEMLPTVYEAGIRNIGLYIMGGILLQIVLEFFSKGAEHGHVHLHSQGGLFPWTLFVSLSIHSFLEGIPIHGHEHLIWGIVVHKFPIAVILALFFVEAGFKQRTTLLFLTLFSVMTPLGSYTAETFAIVEKYYVEASALVIGIFLHVSTTILFESSEGHSFNLAKILVVILATVLAFLL